MNKNTFHKPTAVIFLVFEQAKELDLGMLGNPKAKKDSFKKFSVTTN